MRNRMIDDQVLKEGVMPSYFIEGMLYNAPNEKFGGSYESSFVNTYSWITRADESKLVTASGLHWLVREGTHVSIPSAKFNDYLNAVRSYWQNWK